jgi:hypothetical protein
MFGWLIEDVYQTKIHKPTNRNTHLEGNQPAQANGNIARRGEVFIFKKIVREIEVIAQGNIQGIVVDSKWQLELAIDSIK